MNSFDPSVLKIMTTYICRYVFKKISEGKLGKAAQELCGIVGTLNLSQRAFLFKQVRYVVGVPFVSASEGSRARPGEEKKAMEPLHFQCIMI